VPYLTVLLYSHTSTRNKIDDDAACSSASGVVCRGTLLAWLFPVWMLHYISVSVEPAIKRCIAARATPICSHLSYSTKGQASQQHRRSPEVCTTSDQWRFPLKVRRLKLRLFEFDELQQPVPIRVQHSIKFSPNMGSIPVNQVAHGDAQYPAESQSL